jgi:glyoxylase-like metal-dependent hydrolase (beta-lactamase superfamily II)
VLLGRRRRSLYCGDLAQSGATVWIPFELRGDLAEYLASIERVLALRPRGCCRRTGR